MNNLKKSSHSWFSKECINCLNRTFCISAGSFGRCMRNYFLTLKGYSYPPNEAMKKGTEWHELMQTGLDKIETIGIGKTLVRMVNLRSGEPLELAEMPVCSPTIGLKGVIDKIRFQYSKDSNNIRIDIFEFKSSFNKKHIFQLASYGKIFSSNNTYFGYPKKTRKGIVRKMQKLFPSEMLQGVKVAIVLHLQIKDGHTYDQFWMIDNKLTPWAETMDAIISMKKKAYKNFHKAGLYFLHEIPEPLYCKHSIDYCPFWEICQKFGYNSHKTKQRYFGKKQTLIKNKPAIR